MRYLVAQEIKSETKVSKNIYLFDFFFLILYMAVSVIFGTLVHESLRMFFYVYSFLAALFLTGKSHYNRRRRNYESIAILIRRDMQVYHPVLNISREPEKEEGEKEVDDGLW